MNATFSDAPGTARHHPASREQMERWLAEWVACGWLREVDAAFARFLASEAPDAHALLLLAAALASHQLGRGHACLDLQATLANPAFVEKVFTAQALTATGGTPEELAATLETKRRLGAELTRIANLKYD